MDIGISTRCFGTTPVTLDLLERLRRAEFRHIELHATLPGFDYHNHSLVRSVARWFRENELPAPSLHLPFATDQCVIASRPMERQRSLDEIKRSLELGDLMALNFVVLHLGEPGQQFNPVVFDHAYAAIAAIQSFSGARVLVETLSNDIATFERILEFKTASQIPNAGICYDTGHGEMGEMGGQVDAIHLDDNNGNADDHLWPFEGTRNWPTLVEKVLASFNGPIILEANDDRLQTASNSRARLKDLIDEARDSIEEFRLKYKLPAPQEDEE
jgi:sugar phosphate isomerase/epimerase